MLPDDVLLEIFDLCRQDAEFTWFTVWGQNGLVHVCQRWRRLVFGSPRRLDLQLHCTRGIPVRKSLGCWPPFHITIRFSDNHNWTSNDEDGLFAALEHPDRVRQVYLNLTGPLLERVFTVMQQQFSVLTHLTVEWDDDESPLTTIPSGFLGGSAPCLQHMHLNGIPFPTLPTLLSSTSDLVHLHLHDIIQEGYISLEAMITCLAALPKLKLLHIGFKWAPRPDQLCLPSIPQILLPVLTSFEFHGASSYLEELISRIDSPRLKQIYVRYSHQPFDFQVTQLFQFIDRSEDSKLALIRDAYVNISRYRVVLEMYSCSGSRLDWGRVSILTHCRGFDRQNSYLAQLLGQPSALFSRVAHLKLHRHRADEDRYNDEWLPVLRRFSAARTLHVVSGKFAGDITLTLKDLPGEMVAEVLPDLELIYLGDQPESCIEKFLAARRLSGRPVTIVKTKVEFCERVKSYLNE